MSHHVKARKHTRQQGFTLIELVFAMVAFSIMLVVAVSGLLNAMFIYNQSNVSRDNQQQARTIIDTIGRDIRSAQSATVRASNTQLCLTGTSDGYVLYSAVPYDSSDPNKVRPLRRQLVSTCTGVPAIADTEILTTTGISVVDSTDPTKSGLTFLEIIQPAVTGITPQQTVRVSLNLARNVSTSPSVRARQFSSQFLLQSTYLVRGSGG